MREEQPHRTVFVVADLLSGENALSVRGQAVARALGAVGGVTVVCGAHHNTFSAEGVVVEKMARRLPKNDRSFSKRIIGELSLGLEMARAVRRQRADHVVITTPPFIVTLVVWSSLIASRTPYTLDVRDLYPEVYARAGLLRKEGLPYQAVFGLVRRIYAGASVLTTVTPELQSYLAAMLPGRIVHLCSNGFSEAIFFPPVREAAGPIVIISHGNFGELFDLDAFATIARDLAEQTTVDYRIRIIGFGKKLDALRALALPHVEVFGPRANAEIGALLREAHIGLSVHRHYDDEGRAFPVKVFEFIGSGLPMVVMPRNEGGRAVVDRGFGFTFEKDEVDEATSALKRLVEDGDERRRMAAVVRQGRTEFSLDAQAARFATYVDGDASKDADNER